MDSCGTCKFSHHCDRGGFVCRRFPPKMEPKGPNESWRVWPSIMPKDWCGEWRSKEPTHEEYNMGPYLTHVLERLKDNFIDGLKDLDSIKDRIREQDVTIEEKLEIIDAQEGNEDKIIELSAKLKESEAISESRLKSLTEASNERAEQWKRAENLEGLIDQITETCKPDSVWLRDTRGDKVWQILKEFRGIR